MMDKLQKFCVISLTQGGRHADNTVDLQEFMIMPTGAENMEQAIRMCAEVYQFLRIILKQKGLSTAVGDEGGFAPDLSDSESVLEVILEAVKKAGYEPGKDISIAIDAAASELYDEERGVYVFPGEGKMKGEEVLRDSGEMIEYYEKLAEKFPIVSIEDGLEEDDWEGWKQMTKRLGDKISVCHEYQTSCMWYQTGSGKCHFDKIKPDRNTFRSIGCSGNGTESGIQDSNFSQIRRIGRFIYRRSGSCHRCRPD